MPELPEVEVTRRSLVHRITGARIQRVVVGKPLRWALGCPTDRLIGLTVQAVTRRGKYLLLWLASVSAPTAADAGVLLVHLGMSGSLLFEVGSLPVGPHDHFVLGTDLGALRLRDPRRFGAVVYAPDLADARAVKLLGHLGMEPLSDEFDVGRFVGAVRRCRAPIKQILLGGQVVVGVGNIYASEVLHRVGIHPQCPGNQLDGGRLERLHKAIGLLLQQAVERGGTTLRDFSSADGQAGHFQADVSVYGRGGQPCFSCGHEIQRIVQGQRSTYFCAVCQPC